MGQAGNLSVDAIQGAQCRAARTFAFVVHPRTRKDVACVYPTIARLPLSAIEAWARRLSPFIAGPVYGPSALDGTELHGFVAVCPLMPRDLLADRRRALRAVRATVELAEQQGAEFVGLGGLLPAVTGGGTWLRGKVRAKITTGRAMTPLVLAEYVRDVAALTGQDLALTPIAVIGAAGAIGSVTAVLLTRMGARNLLLIETVKASRRLSAVVSEIAAVARDAHTRVGVDLSELPSVRIAVVASASASAFVRSRDLAPGTVLIDDSHPTNLDASVEKRSDVVVLSGGAARMPNVRVPFLRHTFSDDDEHFSCFAEVALMAANGHPSDLTVGMATQEQISLVRDWAATRKVTRGSFHNPWRTYSDEDVRQVAMAWSAPR